MLANTSQNGHWVKADCHCMVSRFTALPRSTQHRLLRQIYSELQNAIFIYIYVFSLCVFRHLMLQTVNPWSRFHAQKMSTRKMRPWGSNETYSCFDYYIWKRKGIIIRHLPAEILFTLIIIDCICKTPVSICEGGNEDLAGKNACGIINLDYKSTPFLS